MSKAPASTFFVTISPMVEPIPPKVIASINKIDSIPITVLVELIFAVNPRNGTNL